MLAISPQRDSNGDEREAEVGNCLASTEEFCNEFMGDDFLEDIDFDDLFAGLDDGDVLPDLEVDPAEILAALSVPHEEDPGTAAAAVEVSGGDGQENAVLVDENGLNHAEEVLSAREKADDLVATAPANSSFSEETDRGRKTSAKGSQGKRKVKVDWTPELHRRFVQVVEQLGIRKAVPSRILELMGIDGLTRHNVASHLQKYRSHRKHLLAREEEAWRWSQRRYMYAGGDGGGGDGAKRDIINPWLLPTIGFPPPPLQPLGPLHVWGHPTVDQSHVHLWPKHLAPAPSPPPRPWAPQPPLPPPPTNPPYWLTHYLRGPGDGWLPNALTQGTPCFPQPPLTASLQVPPVPGFPPRPLYRPENVVPDHSSKLSSSLLSLDAHPSKESIDAAIRDVLARPSLPLPLGLKTPSLDGVLGDSQRQGISKTASL